MPTPDRGRFDSESEALPRLARSKRIKKKPESLAETIADGLLVLEVVGSVLAIGAVHRPVLLGFALPVLVGGFVSYVWLRPRSIRICAPAVLMAGLAVYTLLQALPLPVSVLRVVAPANAYVWGKVLAPFGEQGPTWASLSMDPGASCTEAVKWLLYAGIFTLMASASARRGASWGATVVFASGVLLALVTLGHGLAGATTVYGVYEPHFGVAQWHVSPLLNGNTLAGYLNLATLCGLGLLSAREPILPRWLAGLGVATMVGVALVSASRAGVAVLPLGFLLVAVILWWRPRRSAALGKTPAIRSSSGLLLLVAAGGTVFAALGITPATWQELYDKNLQKLETIAWVRPLVAAHPWFGIGRGAFESVFSAFKPSPGNTVHAYAENFPAQWISEWGLPVATFALVAFGWMFRPGHVGVRRSVVCAAAWTGMVILLLQNQLDLALEIPGVAIAAAAVLGSIWGDGRRRGTPVGGTGPELDLVAGGRWFVPAALGAAVVVVSAIVGAMRAAPYAVADENRHLHAALVAIKPGDKAAYAALRQQLRDPLLRHPAEPYFYLMGAMASRLGKDENAMPWLVRALERANVNGAAHVMVADVLIERGALAQALLELRFAVHDDPDLSDPVVQRMLAWTHDYDMLVRAAPPGSAGAALLGQMASALQAKGNEPDRILSERIDSEVLSRDATLAGPHARLAYRLIRQTKERGRDACPEQSLDRCERIVREHVAAVERAQPRTSAPDRMMADWLEATGRAAEADKVLEARCDSVEDRASCLYARLTLVAAPSASPATSGGGSLQVAKVAAVAKELAAASCTANRSACAATCSWIGDVLSSRGDWGGTVGYYARAAVEDPTEARYVTLANAAARIGAHGQAADALEAALRLHGGPDPELANRIREERLQVIGRMKP